MSAWLVFWALIFFVAYIVLEVTDDHDRHHHDHHHHR